MGDLNLDKTRQIAARAISPLCMPTAINQGGDFKTYRGIPHNYYYLIFLLLVDLLGYKYVGPGEKMAYSIAVELNGRQYYVVYSKFGMKIEYYGDGEPERVFTLVKKGIRAVRKYYEWRAEQAAGTSDLNLVSKSSVLWQKYQYLRQRSTDLFEESQARKDEVIKADFEGEGYKGTHYSFPAEELLMEANWTAETAVDAFFAWSEHVLVHIAVLQGKLTTGSEVAALVRNEWSAKCKLVLDLRDPDDKAAFDEISQLKSTLRNYVAHGSFGRDGAMFHFHSRVGAIPLRLLDQKSNHEFAFGSGLNETDIEDFDKIDRFTERLFFGSRSPAKIYLESGLPTILSYTKNGLYNAAMVDDYKMEEFAKHLSRVHDDAANMDF